MAPNSFLAKLLRFIGIFFMGLAVLFTLAGGIGTSCAAFAPTNWDSMAPLARVQFLYIAYVIIGVGAGIWGIKALIGLIRGTSDAFRDSLIVLLVGGGAALAQVISSRIVRGSSMPTDMRLYTSILALIIFLIFRIPGIWRGVNYDRGQRGSNSLAGGLTAIVMGTLALTVHLWAAPTHTFGGFNYADVWHVQIAVAGWAAVVAGLCLVVRAIWKPALARRVELKARLEQAR